MVAPIFKKATNTTPGDAFRFSAPDITYMMDVLDGTHPTDRIQIQNIEGAERLTAPHWIVRKKPSDLTTIEILNTKTSTIDFNGTELYDLFNSLTASSSFIDGQNILIKPTTDNSAYNAGESQATFTKDVIIWGYGAMIKGGTSAHSSGGALRTNTNGKYIKVYGLTFDSTDTTNTTKKLGTFIGGGSTSSSITCKLCHIRDCRFLNTFNYSVNVAAKNNGTDSQPDDSTLIVENCLFDTGTTSDSTNEHILANALKYVRVSNCVFLGNKVGYVSAQNVSFNNCFSDTNGRTEGEGLGIHAENASVTNMRMRGGGLVFRPFTAVHWGTNYASNKRVNVSGYTNERITSSYSPIEVTGYDQTYSMGQVTIEDFWIGVGSAANVLLNQTPTHSRISSLVVRNGYIEAFDTNNTIVNAVDHSTDFMVISNVKTPVYSDPANQSPVRLLANQSTCDIDYLNIKDIYPLPTTNIVTQSISDVGGTPFNSTIKCATPLINGQNSSRAIGSGTGTRTLQFLSNRGKATFNGDGSTLTFAIPHKLISTPSFAQITAGSTAARGPFNVTVGSTNVNAVYTTAPASGTNNVVLYWSAVSS